MRKLRLLVPTIGLLVSMVAAQGTTAHATTAPQYGPTITQTGTTFQGYPVVSVKPGSGVTRSAMTPAERAALPAGAAADTIDCTDWVSDAYIESNYNGLWWTEEQTGYPAGYTYEMRARSTVKGPWQQFALCWDATQHAFVIWSYENQLWVTEEQGDTGIAQYMLRARSSTVGAWQLFDWQCWPYQNQPPASPYTDFESDANNLYVSEEQNYTGISQYMLRARSATAGNWEVTDVFNAAAGTFWTVCP